MNDLETIVLNQGFNKLASGNMFSQARHLLSGAGRAIKGGAKGGYNKAVRGTNLDQLTNTQALKAGWEGLRGGAIGGYKNLVRNVPKNLQGAALLGTGGVAAGAYGLSGGEPDPRTREVINQGPYRTWW